MGRDTGPVARYAAGLTIRENWASEPCQLNSFLPGRWGPSVFNLCMGYHLSCGLGVRMNWSVRKPPASWPREG